MMSSPPALSRRKFAAAAALQQPRWEWHRSTIMPPYRGEVLMTLTAKSKRKQKVKCTWYLRCREVPTEAERSVCRSAEPRHCLSLLKRGASTARIIILTYSVISALVAEDRQRGEHSDR